MPAISERRSTPMAITSLEYFHPVSHTRYMLFFKQDIMIINQWPVGLFYLKAQFSRVNTWEDAFWLVHEDVKRLI